MKMDKAKRRSLHKQKISICIVWFYLVITEIWHFRPILGHKNEDF